MYFFSRKKTVTLPSFPTIPPPLTCAAGLSVCCLPGPYQCGVRYPPIAGGN